MSRYTLESKMVGILLQDRARLKQTVLCYLLTSPRSRYVMGPGASGVHTYRVPFGAGPNIWHWTLSLLA